MRRKLGIAAFVVLSALSTASYAVTHWSACRYCNNCPAYVDTQYHNCANCGHHSSMH
jgi:hypothetical protein